MNDPVSRSLVSSDGAAPASVQTTSVKESWVIEKQRICRAEVAAKNLRAVMALRQKHTALLHELRARDLVAMRHRGQGQSLIESKHPKSGEIERRLASLSQQWDVLRQLATDTDKQLADAAEAHQELLKLSEARRLQLEDAIKLYSLFAEWDDFDKWIRDKEKMLRTDEPQESVDNAKRLYEIC
ncbi:unnamed protein product [Danaus chrysippus]|uniref:(African queen) hypothetical protein n=1 Tax=Danaus chrysippus TaxID=151541 RepID=A0A8J2W924_9NEOP|nr:unnamed protein product [Danaus chrysippus]